MAEIALPAPTRAFLAAQEYAMLTSLTDQGAVLVLKAPARYIAACRGNRPILVRWELHSHLQSPVIRLVLEVADGPDSRLSFESFANVGDREQLTELRDLLSRPYLRILFYDEAMRHRLSKRAAQPADDQARRLVPLALELLEAIPTDSRDFDAAKAAVMAANPFPGEG